MKQLHERVTGQMLTITKLQWHSTYQLQAQNEFDPQINDCWLGVVMGRACAKIKFDGGKIIIETCQICLVPATTKHHLDECSLFKGEREQLYILTGWFYKTDVKLLDSLRALKNAIEQSRVRWTKQCLTNRVMIIRRVIFDFHNKFYSM